ncbi:hypothetical protein AB0J21_28920 [Streptomyces sp. NPDC049954]
MPLLKDPEPAHAMCELGNHDEGEAKDCPHLFPEYIEKDAG